MISEFKTDVTTKIHRYSKINGAIKSQLGKNVLPKTKSRLHNAASKAAMKYGSEVWGLNREDCEQLEAVRTKFLRSLAGLTRLDHQRNTTIR
jgi:hypothetical protein